jgi:hypothetical protein
VALSERVLLALAAAAMTFGSVELVRREVLLHRRRGQSWLRVDASAAGAMFTATAAVAAWTLLVLDRAPIEGVAGILAALLVMLFLLLTDERVH